MTSDLFKAKGVPAFGVYSGEIRDIGLSPCRPAVPWAIKRFRTKRWRFVGFYSPELVVGLAVVHAGYLGSAFAYAFDTAKRSLVEFSGRSPLGMNCRISDHLFEGEQSFVKGRDRIVMSCDPKGATCRIDVDVGVSKGRLIIEAQIDESTAAAVPHQIVSPTPKGRFAFTHKTAGLPAEGRVATPDGEFELKRGETFAAVDHTAGYHDYRWEWRWASLGGLAGDGTRVGLNLVAPVHHPTITENALWVDGRCHPLGRADFTFDRQAILEPWRIRTDDGVVDLRFEPLGERAETINVGLVLSRFHQPIGRFSGLIALPDGKALTLADVPGVVEDHETRW